jgi:hypothetical protein
MVAPTSWEQFLGPQDKMSKPQQGSQIPPTEEMNLHEQTPIQKQATWEDFQNPESYQGEPNPSADETTAGWLVRNMASTASRVGEQYLGRYGNTEQLMRGLLKNYPQSMGLMGYALHKLMGQDRWNQLIGEKQLPTSQELKKASTEAFGDYLEPKSKGEKIFQEFAEDVGAVLPGPGFGRLPTGRGFLINNLGIPASANAVKQTVEGLGFGEDKANQAKLATWLTLFLSRNVNAPQYASQLMNQGRNAIPTIVQIDVPRFQNRLQQVANNPLLLHSDPRTALAREQLANINRDLANGQTSVRSLMTAYDGLNAAKRNRGLFELNRTDRNFARRSIDEVRNAIRDEIMDAGAAYPEALNNWRNGIEAWATIHRSRGLTNTISEWARGPYAKILSGPVAGLFGMGGYAGIKKPIIALPLAGAIPATYKGIQTLVRVFQNPDLARYYWDALSAAAQENAPLFIKNYMKLEKGLGKSVKEKREPDNE